MESPLRCGYTVGKVGTPAGLPQVRCAFRRDSGSLTFDVPPSETSRWRAVARVLRSPIDALGCALLPASCVLCGSSLPHLSSVPICQACWTEFPVAGGNLCARCGDPLDAPMLPGPTISGLCRACRMAPPPFARAVAYGPYQDRMKAAIHALKYDRLHPVARGLGRMLAEAIAQMADEAPTEMLVVPVPLHRFFVYFVRMRHTTALPLASSRQRPLLLASTLCVPLPGIPTRPCAPSPHGPRPGGRWPPSLPSRTR